MTARGKEIDADRLMALLYGELDDGAAEAARARVAESPDEAAELAGLERVRGLFRELPAEEPPPRISAQLLAEAARSAPSPRRAAVGAAEVGFWARLLSWLSPVQHPGLAAAATLVLVAGVAGVLVLRKGDDLTRAGRAAPPSSPTEAADTAAATGEATTPPAAEPAKDRAGAEAPADLDDREDGVVGGATPEPSLEKSRSIEDKPARGRKMAKGSADKKEYSKEPPPKAPDSLRSGTVYGLSEQDMLQGDSAGAGPGGSGGAANQAAQPQAAEPPPPPVVAPAPTATTKARPPTAAELHARAVDAALDKRCSDVRALGAEIRAINADYYKTKFAGDKRLTRCLSSPTQYPARK
jgi:hypothetical protein